MGAVLTVSRPTSSRPRKKVATIQDVVDREPSDAELIERTSAGDSDAFEELYRRYTRPVLSLALRRLGDAGRAEDALQEAFAAIWRSAGSYDRQRGQGGAWLYTVARNAIIDAARRRPEAPVEPNDEASNEPGPPDRAERAWLSWRVHRAIGELSENERAVIELAYWRGLSQSEISEALSVPLGTVKTRTRNALGRLAGLLEEELS
jgi:RNA polymerase sigma-70 factor (ECF subfamily)